MSELPPESGNQEDKIKFVVLLRPVPDRANHPWQMSLCSYWLLTIGSDQSITDGVGVLILRIAAETDSTELLQGY